MSKIISYSLWGQSPKYLHGAVENARLVSSYYPEFRCRFYVSNDVPGPVICHLEELGAEIVEVESSDNWSGLFWRFRALEDADICLVRDCDSRLTQRERDCFDVWQKTDFPMFTMYDHPFHPRSAGIMPGLSGFRKDAIPSLKYDIELWMSLVKDVRYGSDYMLIERIWQTRFRGKVLIFDSIHPGFEGAIDFPTPRKGLEFVGKVWNSDGSTTVLEHEVVLQNWIVNKK